MQVEAVAELVAQMLADGVHFAQLLAVNQVRIFEPVIRPRQHVQFAPGKRLVVPRRPAMYLIPLRHA